MRIRQGTHRGDSARYFRRLLTAFLVVGLAPIAQAQSGIDTDVLRRQLASDLDEVHIGTGYAAIVDFAISRDISSATFYPNEVDGVKDPSLTTSKLPFRFVLGDDAASVRPYIQGHVAYQTLEAEFAILADESVNSQWRTAGASLAIGAEVPVGDSLLILPAVSAGYGRIENRADYSGPVGNDILRPVFDNLLFDWETNAVVYGASLGLGWRRDYEIVDVEFLANTSHHLVRSSSSSSQFIDFEGRVTVLDIEANVIRPTPLSVGNYPLALVGLFGATAMFGPDRDALGFDKFFEVGLGLEGDLSEKGWKIKSLRVGVKGIFGPDVSGWGIIVGYGFH